MVLNKMLTDIYHTFENYNAKDGGAHRRASPQAHRISPFQGQKEA